MKNVFGDSSDSEAELAPLLPPPKKFKPPTEPHDSENTTENLKPGDMVKQYNEFVPNPVGTLLDLNDNELENSIDISVDELNEDFDTPRLGLGSSKNNATLFNQKASLHESIIDEGSIGYMIMAKMGYRPGQTIGSSENRHALVEPLPIRAKPARTGIGMATFTPKTASGISSESASTFKNAAKMKHSEKSLRFMITKLQKFCLQESGQDIELEHGNISPENVNILWRDYATSTLKVNKRTALFGERTPETRDSLINEASDIDDPGMLEDKLRQLIKYAREEFHYCPYCGIKYDDDSDLSTNCPGDTEEVHQL